MNTITISPISFAETKQNATHESDISLLVKEIKTNEKFASQFFFCKTKGDLSIASIRSHILSQVYETYHVVLQPYEFSTLVYEHIWSEGSWKPLDTCPQNGAFFPWLRTVAFRAVLKHLEENGLIKVHKARTVANTRLDLKNKPLAYCDAVINDLVDDVKMRSFLKAVYVDHLERQEIQKRFDLTEEDFNTLSVKSEAALKKALINRTHPYNDALVDLNQRKINLSFDDCIGIDNVAESSEELNSLIYDILDIKYGDPDAKQKVEDFLYEFSNNMPWKAEDKFVFQSRFIKDLTPVEVVKDLPNRSRAWLDTRFSRLNKDFRKAICKWWRDKTVLAA